MSATLLLLLALGSCIAGMAWLALAMDVHWRQVRGAGAARRSAVLALRTAGTVALVVSLLLCLRADHPTMAALVWVMSLAVGGLCVAFALAWRPGALAPLVGWLR
jgi:hypothetical protein